MIETREHTKNAANVRFKNVTYFFDATKCYYVASNKKQILLFINPNTRFAPSIAQDRFMKVVGILETQLVLHGVYFKHDLEYRL